MRTYEAPLKVTVTLLNKTFGSEKTQDIFLADMPMMTPHGSFIVSGVERAIVPQLARSFGAFFVAKNPGKQLGSAQRSFRRAASGSKSNRSDGAIYVKIDRKRKFPVTNLLTIFGAGTREESSRSSSERCCSRSTQGHHARTTRRSPWMMHTSKYTAACATATSRPRTTRSPT
jgi:DNA-directed RNA polymerase subunit beta